jgi:hypothetical protein
MKHRIAPLLSLLASTLACAAPQAPPVPQTLTDAAAARFAGLALKCLHQEYPNHISHTLNSDADARPPRELTPAFYGCLDWHSDVHGHWLLVRLLRLMPQAPFAAQARSELQRSFTAEKINAEVTYLQGAGRASFERPYGLAWLLQLAAELHAWDDPDARRWSATLAPLEAEAAARIESWVPKLHYPIRIGEHDQTAFAFGLVWDWAQVVNDAPMHAVLRDAAQRCLAEADFMRRVLEPQAFAGWLSAFLPGIPKRAAAANASPWLAPGVVTDRADPKLAHVDGLNLSRAWMLEGIAHGLPAGDPRIAALLSAANEHAAAALPAVTGEYYEGGHWLGTFAVYLTSRAGLSARR